jgi:hypothetical protein
MDISDLFPFIVAGIIFVLNLLFGKKKEQTPVQPTEPNAPTQNIKDILKEIESKMENSKIKQTNTTKTVTSQIKSQYSKSTKPAKKVVKKQVDEEYKKPGYKSLDVVIERGLKEEERNRDQHLNPYKIQNKQLNSYQKLFQSKDAIKKAFIMNELFQRKF